MPWPRMLNQCCHKNNFNSSIFLIFFLFILLPFSLFARDIDWDKLEKKARKHIDDRKNSGSSNKSDKREKSVNVSLPEQPTGRMVVKTEKKLSEKDKRHIFVHMKLANRHFKRKNYDKTISELNTVFDREPDHSGGRFMRAVIAARKRNYLTAWQNILIAQKGDPDNSKLKSFIEKLSTKMAEPQKFIGVPGVYRPVPTYAGEKAADIIEKFLSEPPSRSLIAFTTEEFKKENDHISYVIKLDFSTPVDADTIMNIFKTASGEAVSRVDDQKDKKHLELKIKITQLPLQNEKVKKLSSYYDFVKIISTEADVVLSNSVEKDMPDNKLEATSQVSARTFASLNDFLRKASPYAHSFRVLNLKLSHIPNSQEIIWKGKVKILYQL
ncbi:MAG: tetratricopeptide repeat protein [Candidatus Rifleibacteriota bacterium]